MAEQTGQPLGRSPWALGAAGLCLLATACATTPAPVIHQPGPPNAAPRAEAPVGPPRIVSAASMSCVPYARQRSGVMIQGDANTWWSQAALGRYSLAYAPVVGSVMVLRIGVAGERGHVAFVTRIVGSREIIVDHANWHGRGEVAVDVPVVDVSPANDWSQVRVFWVDTAQMGARTYPVEGFILPERTFAAS